MESRYLQPTVLVDVPEDSTAITEETFGPTVTVSKVRDMDEAVDLANATSYGLGSTVFSQGAGPELARRLRSGMTAVNAVISFAAIPSLPFGGVGDSGFGRIHGPDGLKEFTYAKAVARQRMKPALALTTFARTAKTDTDAGDDRGGAARRRHPAAEAAQALEGRLSPSWTREGLTEIRSAPLVVRARVSRRATMLTADVIESGS